jgi:hypothetical protein
VGRAGRRRTRVVLSRRLRRSDSFFLDLLP